ncbi:PPC domain-containing DNA-binding protein [Coleofasciculus sp.]|uniref:PPC domain-containing DNA-binding protein n=1 Tax=Coleofasciculus sp. TaxID=3100458 RepID=UPI003A43C8D0
MQIFAIRLKPNDDLKASLGHFVKQHQIEAGFMITAVGSLKQATLRFAGQNYAQAFKRRFEIVSLVGTLSIHKRKFIFFKSSQITLSQSFKSHKIKTDELNAHSHSRRKQIGK